MTAKKTDIVAKLYKSIGKAEPISETKCVYVNRSISYIKHIGIRGNHIGTSNYLSQKQSIALCILLLFERDK